MRNKAGTWYKRLADIPKVGYAGDQDRRKRLPNANVAPRVERFDFGDGPQIALSWTTRDGTSSASPVHELAFGSHGNESPEELRERVLNALELPGAPSDYHFLIQGAHEQLWGRRHERPDQYPMIEWLCELDLRLLEAHPETLWIGDEADSGQIRIVGFDRLVSLYATEGFEAEMTDIAARISKLTGKPDSPGEPRYLVRRT
jgi:hypothetical protein